MASWDEFSVDNQAQLLCLVNGRVPHNCCSCPVLLQREVIPNPHRWNVAGTCASVNHLHPEERLILFTCMLNRKY